MKRRNDKFLIEKRIIALKIAEEENRQAIRNQGYIELEKPYHYGYNAKYVLRDDILNKINAEFYQEALDACMESIWSRNEDFVYTEWKTKKKYVAKPKLKKINQTEYDRLSIGARRFYVESHIYDKYWQYGYKDKHYICTLSYELKIEITKNYITHRREHDSVLYQKEAEIEKELYTITDGYPWGSSYSSLKFFNRKEHKRFKLKAKRELVEVKNTYKGIKTLNDLLDLK